MSLGVDSRYAVQMNRLFLRVIGVWPLAAETHLSIRLLQNVSVVASYFCICFLLIPCTLHAVLEEPDPVLQLKLVGPISFNVMAMAKYSCLVNGNKEMGECFCHIEEDWKLYKERHDTVKLSIMQEKAKVGRFLTLFCAAFMFGGAVFFLAIMPLTAGRLATSAFLDKMAQIEASNSTNLDIRMPRPLTYPVYERLMNVQDSPWYELTYFLQCLSASVSCTIAVAVCSLAAVYVVHVCSQLEIVMHLIDSYVSGSDAGSDRKMKEIVEKHTRALSFAKKVEEYLSPLCFVEFVGCTFNIVLLGYYFITEWESRNTISTMTYCTLLMSFTFNMFIYCYIGEILTKQCEKVGEITYEIDWYKLPSKKAVDITLIMFISSFYPARITAGKMVYLSMSSFCNVMKTAFSYMNILRTLML